MTVTHILYFMQCCFYYMTVIRGSVHVPSTDVYIFSGWGGGCGLIILNRVIVVLVKCKMLQRQPTRE